MTTEDMRIALLWHFRYVLQYPLVVSECITYGYSLADILAIRKIVVEVEIKKHLWEITQDLKKKRKHYFYLNQQEWVSHKPMIPNKFYFALPSELKNLKNKKYLDIIPKSYGLIVVGNDRWNPHYCKVLKRGKYLVARDDEMTKLFKDMLTKRLTAENINLRIKLKGLRNESPQAS